MTLSSFRSFLFVCAGLLAIPLDQVLAEEPYFRETDIYQAQALLPECYRPSLALLEDGTLACAWASGSGMQALDTAIRISFKSPESNSWTEPAVPADEPGYPDNYPLLAKLPDGRLRLIYATLYREKRKNPPDARMEAWHLKYHDSKDGGRIWGGEFFLIPKSGRVPSGAVAELPGGGLLLGLTDLRSSGPLFLISRDGKGWDFSKEFDSAIQGNGPALAQRNDCSLLSFIRPYGEDPGRLFILRSESRDRGRTWSEPEFTDLKNPSSAVDLRRLRNGHLVLAFNDNQTSRTDLSLALSLDEGRTWSHRRVLEDAPGRFSYPALAQDADGLVHVSYTFRRTHIKHVEVNEAWIKDGK